MTIGNFDGVHRGHRAVIDALRGHADDLGASTAIVTFEPHTLETLRPEHAPPQLTSLERKLELLEETTLDYGMVLLFDKERAQQSAEDFVEGVLVDRLHTKAIMVGEDFRFGRGARGDVDLLARLGRDLGFEVLPIEIVSGPQGVYSSTSVREAIADGRLQDAEHALTRPHDVRGTVVEGDRRGRTLGFPTANVDVGERVCLPPLGVYAGRARIVQERDLGHPELGRWWDAIVNFGVRPTFRASGGEPRPLIEAHLLDFEGDLYGEAIDVGFVERVRSERRFDSADDLRHQIQMDVEKVRGLLGAH